MSAHDVAVAATSFGAALVFVRSYDVVRRYRREATYKRVRAAYIASKVVPLHFKPGAGDIPTLTIGFDGTSPKPLGFFERELAEHTCSFGDACEVRIRAKQLDGILGRREVSTAMRAYLVLTSATVILPWLLTEVTHALGWGVKR